MGTWIASSGRRAISNTTIRELMRAAARGARVDGNEELRRAAGQSGKRIVGRGWSRHVRDTWLEEMEARQA